MTKVPKAIGSMNYLDLFLMGGIKFFEERALTPYIGNANLKSGGVKIASGMAIKKFAGSGTLQNAASGAFIVDGVEDIILSFLGGNGLGLGTGGGESW